MKIVGTNKFTFFIGVRIYTILDYEYQRTKGDTLSLLFNSKIYQLAN
jgi:hypothetical protein